MIKIWDDNGLPFYSAVDIHNREHIVKTLTLEMMHILEEENKSWVIRQIESPILIPTEFVSSEYNKDDYFTTGQFHLRPETTAASYAFAAWLNSHQHFVPPSCILQSAKSFRRENDQVTKNMRFKEFYQLEFQCIYTEGTKNDYQTALLEPLQKAVKALTGGLQTRVVESDRLPSYSLKTMDIEVDMGYKWLEVCSISLRNDVPFEWNGKKLLNCEVAFGTDRLTMILGGMNEPIS